MRPPSFRSWLLGSRFTAPFIILGSAYHTWQWWQAGGIDNTGLFTLALMGFSTKAAYQVHSYRQWQADWRAMAPGGDKPRWRPRLATVATILCLMVIGMAMVWATGPDAPAQLHSAAMPIAMICALLGMVLLLMRTLCRLWACIRQRRLSRLPVVSLAIRKPIRRPLSIRNCYRRLPPYCKLLLQRGRP